MDESEIEAALEVHESASEAGTSRETGETQDEAPESDEASDASLLVLEEGDETSVSSIDFVLVHGLHGDRTRTWSGDETEGLTRDRSFVDWLHTKYPESRIVSFGYSASDNRAGLYTLAGIREKALKLLDALLRFRKSASLVHFQPLIFIAQDLGGIIVKEALFTASVVIRNYWDINTSTRALVFLEVPHRSTCSRDLEDWLARLMYSDRNPRPIHAKRCIEDLGKTVAEVNGSFVLSYSLSKETVINVYPGVEDPALQAFDRFASTFEVPFETRYEETSSITEDTGFDEVLAQAINTSLFYSSFDDASFQLMQALQPLAAPTYPLRSTNDLSGRFDWLNRHERFQEWIDSYGPSILHVHATNDASDVSDYLFHCLDKERKYRHTIHFAFDRHDDRRSSMVAMMSTILLQLFYHQRQILGNISNRIEEMLEHRSCTAQELLALVRLSLGSCDSTGVVCIIGGLHECNDSPLALLRELSHVAKNSEQRWKLIVTSAPDAELQAALAEWPAIDLNDRPQDPETVKFDTTASVDFEVSELLGYCPNLQPFEETIKEKLSLCQHDHEWRRLVANSLRSRKGLHTRSAIGRELEHLPGASPQDCFAYRLRRVPHDRRSWARKALTWLLCSFRPLTIWELSAVLMLTAEGLSEDILDLHESVARSVAFDLQETFGDLFIIEHNEIRFGHPDARGFLWAAEVDQEHTWYAVRETAHKDIVEACLFYLSLENVQDTLASSYNHPVNEPAKLSAFFPRCNFIRYAIKYWPRHYKCVSTTDRPIDPALHFFENTKALRGWAQAFWFASNAISRTDRSYQSVLPTLAGLGLQDLFEIKLEQDATETRAFALVEAVRNSQTDIFHQLLTQDDLKRASIEDVLVAAAASCDETILNALIAYAAENVTNFEWPAAVLVRATMFGLETTVKKLLDAGAGPDAPTFRSMTPLHVAARYGHTGLVKLLLQHGASVSKENMQELVPLTLACANGHVAAQKLLLDAPGHVDLSDDTITGAFNSALAYQYHTVIEVLCERCDNFQYEKQDGFVPLANASEEGYNNIVRTLLKKGADPNMKAAGDQTSLYWAVIRGRTEACKLLLEGGATADIADDGKSGFAPSGIYGNLEIAKLLLEHGASVDGLDGRGLCALHHASANGFESFVTYLLDQGANVNQLATDGESPLTSAARKNQATTMEILIDRGADVNYATEAGWTALHLSYDCVETTRVMIEGGADINKKTDMATPLYLASVQNQPEVVELLLSHGPDLEIGHNEDSSDEMPHTALSAAATNSYSEVIRLLVEAGADVNHMFGRHFYPLESAVQNDDEATVRILMDHHPDLALADDDGDTALHCIQPSTSVDIVRRLVNAGSDLELLNKNGYTVLGTAVLRNNEAAVKYLISKKARINVTGGSMGGPLHIACRLRHTGIVRVLVEARADVNLVDPNEGTPVQCMTKSYMTLNDDEFSAEGQQDDLLYLIDDAKADVTAGGGLMGCALNVASIASTPKLPELLLSKGAKADVEDQMGRMAMHLAAAHHPENFRLVLHDWADVGKADKMGRTVLHWAAMGCQVDVAERVIAVERDLINSSDADGWTPLLWAARGCGTLYRDSKSTNHRAMVELLLARGADPCATGQGVDREWSPVKVARYHAADDSVTQVLITKAKEKLTNDGQENTWNDDDHVSRKAMSHDSAFCDCCLATIYGIRYKCQGCVNYDLCYKCYRSRNLIHPSHQFEELGPEYVEEESDASESDDSSDDDSASEDDASDGGNADNGAKADQDEDDDDTEDDDSEST